MLTIPSLIPPDGYDGTQRLYQPFQGLGSKGINNLASKLLLALFPPGSPFFRLRPSVDTEEASQAARDGGDKSIRTAIESALGKREEVITRDIENRGDRANLFEALKLLLVSGNVLLTDVDGLRIFAMSQYVIRRNHLGEPFLYIIEECSTWVELEASIQEKVLEAHPGSTFNDEDEVKLYTGCELREGMWHYSQEVLGVTLEGTEATFPPDKSPFHGLRLYKNNLDWSRSFVEENFGDLKALEGLTRALNQYAAGASKLVFLVKNATNTRIRDLQRAANGAFLSGDANDVGTLQANKYNDMRVVAERAAELEQSLALSFLMGASVRRDAERVTAEEIRLMARELEDGLGGVYSVLTQEFQLPYVLRREARLEKAGKLNKLPKDAVDIGIVTGLDALGRVAEWSQTSEWAAEAQALLGPQEFNSLLKKRAWLKKSALAKGIDVEDVLYSEEEAEAAIAQQKQEALLQQAVPHGMKAIGDMATQAAAQQAPPIPQ